MRVSTPELAKLEQQGERYEREESVITSLCESGRLRPVEFTSYTS